MTRKEELELKAALWLQHHGDQLLTRPLAALLEQVEQQAQQIAYQQLMEKAVRFGECLTDDCRCTPEEVNTSPECAFIKARLFLQSPEVQAWREQHK